jgi:hypothetical protein
VWGNAEDGVEAVLHAFVNLIFEQIKTASHWQTRRDPYVCVWVKKMIAAGYRSGTGCSLPIDRPILQQWLHVCIFLSVYARIHACIFVHAYAHHSMYARMQMLHAVGTHG